MSTGTDTAKLLNWIAALKRQRDDVMIRMKELLTLVEKKNAIDATISNLEKLVALEKDAPAQQNGHNANGSRAGDELDWQTPNGAAVVATTTKRPVWEHARDVVLNRSHPLTAGAVVKGLQEKGLYTDTTFDAARENVRSIMRQRDDVFESLGGGWFALREWPAEKKKRMPVTVDD